MHFLRASDLAEAVIHKERTLIKHFRHILFILLLKNHVSLWPLCPKRGSPYLRFPWPPGAPAPLDGLELWDSDRTAQAGEGLGRHMHPCSLIRYFLGSS